MTRLDISFNESNTNGNKSIHVLIYLLFKYTLFYFNLTLRLFKITLNKCVQRQV